jgi:DNA-binding MarR family transcriptional regulator
LADSAAAPSKIAADTDCAASHVSRALNDLRERELVDLLVPESRKKGRIYGITDQGREIRKISEAQDRL